LVRKTQIGNLCLEQAGNDASSNTAMEGSFRFSTLSSLVGHKARSTYIHLPHHGRKELRFLTSVTKTFYRLSSEDEDSDNSSENDTEHLLYRYRQQLQLRFERNGLLMVNILFATIIELKH
jgi:hypothetical protein